MSDVYGVFDNDYDCVAVDGKESLLEAFELVTELVEAGGQIIKIKYPCAWSREHSGYIVVKGTTPHEIVVDSTDFNE